jgi:hypothetical protein
MSRGLSISLVFCVLALGQLSFGEPRGQEPKKPAIQVEGVQRIHHEKVIFSLRVSNPTADPIFVLGMIWPWGPRIYSVYLEQWTEETGWRVFDCLDMSSDIISVKPGATFSRDYIIELPMSAVCRNRLTNFDGKFRFRLGYFQTRKEGRDYVKNRYTPGTRGPLKIHYVVSEEFEIPAYSRK